MEALGDRIAEQTAHLDAATHRLLADVRAFDAGGGWFHAGAVSCAHWLSWRVGWTLATGREHVRVARRLGELPRIDDALRRGQLSYAKVRALTRVATAATEEALVTDALATTAAQLELICRKYRTVQRLARTTPDEIAARRYVTRRELDDGLVRIEATLLPDEAAAVMAAIEQVSRRVSAGTSPPRFDRADGLVALAQATLRGDAPERSPTEVVVTIPRAALAAEAAAGATPDTLGVLADGTCVSAETARRLACDAGVVEVVEDEAGRPLSVGRRTRTLPAALKRALLHRDGACRFPGCTNRIFLEGHHVRHWADGGETSLANTCLLCSHHHAFVHEHGYRIELRDGAPVFFDPRGRPVRPEPARPATSAAQAWATIRAANDELGITADTGRCRWDGRPVQYDLVVGSLAYLGGYT